MKQWLRCLSGALLCALLAVAADRHASLAENQGAFEKRFVSSWLGVVDGEVTTRTLTIAALAAPGLASAADAARGAKLAYTCHGCHGIPNYRNSYPVYRVPELGGQHVAYLRAALKEYATLVAKKRATKDSEWDAFYQGLQEVLPTSTKTGMPLAFAASTFDWAVSAAAIPKELIRNIAANATALNFFIISPPV